MSDCSMFYVLRSILRGRYLFIRLGQAEREADLGPDLSSNDAYIYLPPYGLNSYMM